MKKLIFNLYDDIPKNVLSDIMKSGLPESGLTQYTLINGEHICVAVKDRVKNETYDIWKVKKL